MDDGSMADAPLGKTAHSIIVSDVRERDCKAM
jgi:hypothetical protein